MRAFYERHPMVCGGLAAFFVVGLATGLWGFFIGCLIAVVVVVVSESVDE